MPSEHSNISLLNDIDIGVNSTANVPLLYHLERRVHQKHLQQDQEYQAR